MTMLWPLILLSIVIGIESLSLGKGNSIIDVTIDCGVNQAANNPVLSILTDVDISAVAKCKNGEKSFTTTDSVHYTLPATLTTRDSLCELNEKDGSDNFDIEVEVHYGELDNLILTRTKIVTVVCTYGGYGKDNSSQHSLRDGPQAYKEKQTFVGGTVPATDLSLSIQTVNDEDAVGAIAFDRRYSLYGSYTGTVQNVGLKPVSCDAISASGERYAVLVAGCGDGLIFDRGDGFMTTGTTFRSPYFFAFHLAHSGNLAFDCNVTLCSPSCEGSSCETNCGPVTSFPISNIQLDSCTGNKFQDTCSFNCDDGYDVVGAAISTCGADGIWTDPVIVCQPKDCGALPQGTLSSGTVNGGSTFTFDANYVCDEGHERVSGKSVIECLATGQWDSDVLQCQPKDCGALPQGTSSSGTVNGGSTFTFDANYVCDEGHERVSGKSVIECLATGQWDSDVLQCQPRDCGVLSGGTFSDVTVVDTTYPNVANYACLDGYETANGTYEDEISCLSSGQWEEVNLECQKCSNTIRSLPFYHLHHQAILSETTNSNQTECNSSCTGSCTAAAFHPITNICILFEDAVLKTMVQGADFDSCMEWCDNDPNCVTVGNEMDSLSGTHCVMYGIPVHDFILEINVGLQYYYGEKRCLNHCKYEIFTQSFVDLSVTQLSSSQQSSKGDCDDVCALDIGCGVAGFHSEGTCILFNMVIMKAVEYTGDFQICLDACTADTHCFFVTTYFYEAGKGFCMLTGVPDVIVRGLLTPGGDDYQAALKTCN